MNEKLIRKKYEKLTKLLIERNLTITTMESCTSGQIASLITDTEGASAILKGAFVTYSNEAKIMQGVNFRTIEKYGVYSKETAEAMADACRNIYNSDIGIGITGTFGNIDPNNSDSEPGKVYFAITSYDATYIFDVELIRCNTRFEYKMIIAEIIVDELFGILSLYI